MKILKYYTISILLPIQDILQLRARIQSTVGTLLPCGVALNQEFLSFHSNRKKIMYFIQGLNQVLAITRLHFLWTQLSHMDIL